MIRDRYPLRITILDRLFLVFLILANLFVWCAAIYGITLLSS